MKVTASILTESGTEEVEFNSVEDALRFCDRLVRIHGDGHPIGISVNGVKRYDGLEIESYIMFGNTTLASQVHKVLNDREGIVNKLRISRGRFLRAG